MATDLGTRYLKVDHAGEHGAIQIYTAQILMARWTAPDRVEELRSFRTHEQRHRAIFAAELARRGSPRCISYGLCGLGGFVLGLVTGLLGRHAIAATTTAVEAVVLRHLDEQCQHLGDSDPAAIEAISAIIDDERTHHDHSVAQLPRSTRWTRLLMPVVSGATESVIWLGMKL